MKFCYLLLIVSLFSTSIFAGEIPLKHSDQYGRYLVREGDFHRAIDEYKKQAFFAATDTQRFEYMLMIARCSRWAGDDESLHRYAEHLLVYGKNHPYILEEAHLQIGAMAAYRGNSDKAVHSLQQAVQFSISPLPKFYLAATYLQKADWDQAQSVTETITEADDQLVNLKNMLIGLSQTGREYRFKSRTTGVLLSTFIPGAGQFYADHPVDGLQAFLMVGALAAMSVVAYEYETDKYGSAGGLFAVSAGITGIFHFANIVGADKTVQYRNMRLRHDIFTRAYNAVDSEYMKSVLQTP
ncbi:hypothetical protein K8I28_12735 [bacterium]|nr:hypothetical protein [bacterium]